MKSSVFDGFTPRTFDFLAALGINNTKIWFAEHKADYEDWVLRPLQQLTGALSQVIRAIDPDIDTTPAVSKTISRIYRDIRFSKDKSPYRNNAWIAFKRPDKEWKGAPAFFFEIYPDSWRFGMGFYDVGRDGMDMLRQRIDRNPLEFLRVAAPCIDEGLYRIQGEEYKRLLDPSKPPAIQTWYNRKNFWLESQHSLNDYDGIIFKKELVHSVEDGFKIVGPLYIYLREIIGGGRDFS